MTASIQVNSPSFVFAVLRICALLSCLPGHVGVIGLDFLSTLLKLERLNVHAQEQLVFISGLRTLTNLRYLKLAQVLNLRYNVCGDAGRYHGRIGVCVFVFYARCA